LCVNGAGDFGLPFLHRTMLCYRQGSEHPPITNRAAVMVRTLQADVA
jgi:hypothetical protein